jgi:hypothetical protein
LLGLKGAEAFVDEEDREVSAGSEEAGPADGVAGGGADGAIHVHGQADDDAFDVLFVDHIEDGADGGLRGGDGEDLVRCGETCACVAEGEADSS